MRFEDKTILITGISGFVGSRMARLLIDGGAEVCGLVRHRAEGGVPGSIRSQGLEGKVRLLEGDLEDISSVKEALLSSGADTVFHLGAQSFVPRSFSNPIETMSSNCVGTANLLEAVRASNLDPVVVFAGSSDEYGLVISSQEQYKMAEEKYGSVFPEPLKIPELPVCESNPLRPMSPYAVSKVYGDFLMRNYFHSYGIKTVVARAFNHEGAGRGMMFVTSVAAGQAISLRLGLAGRITIGNVNAFRDWSHVDDVISGYLLLSQKGRHGEVYNLGSMRTCSVMSYLLMCLDQAGYPIGRIETFQGGKCVDDPLDPERSSFFGMDLDMSRVDGMMLRGDLEFSLQDRGVAVQSGEDEIKIEFDPERFRPAEVPIMLSDARKAAGIGFRPEHCLSDIVRDQLEYFASESLASEGTRARGSI
ncbi:MAG TPA: GDP-mannose 4,6-dehydratase [Methanotrichaceae archaeon]|nr:GDP-mannose 4,6-dehydratase [Methanotrichaceae archaeon]